jgi:hypothetical protein
MVTNFVNKRIYVSVLFMSVDNIVVSVANGHQMNNKCKILQNAFRKYMY